MKKVKYLLATAFTMVIAFVASSCTDGNDWDTDSSKNSYFMPHSIKIEGVAAVGGSTVTVSWETYDKAKSYQIEVASCNGSNYIDPDVGNCKYNGETIAAGDIKNVVPGITFDEVYNVTGEEDVKNLSYTLPDKLGAGQYQLRIRALDSDVKKGSKWRYFYDQSAKNPFFEIAVSGGDEE